MKIFIILALSAVAVFAEPTITTAEIEQKISECLTENGLDPGLVHTKNVNTLRSLSNNCNFIICVNKKIGLMKEDETYDVDFVVNHAKTPEEKTEVKERLTKMLNVCQDEVGEDKCKVATCIMGMLIA